MEEMSDSQGWICREPYIALSRLPCIDHLPKTSIDQEARELERELSIVTATGLQVDTDVVFDKLHDSSCYQVLYNISFLCCEAVWLQYAL